MKKAKIAEDLLTRETLVNLYYAVLENCDDTKETEWTKEYKEMFVNGVDIIVKTYYANDSTLSVFCFDQNKTLIRLKPIIKGMVYRLLELTEDLSYDDIENHLLKTMVIDRCSDEISFLIPFAFI